MSETKLEDLSSAYCPRCGEPELEYGNCKYCDYPEPAASPSPPAGMENHVKKIWIALSMPRSVMSRDGKIEQIQGGWAL